MGFSVTSRLVRSEVKKCPKETSAFSFTSNCSCRILSCVFNTARAPCVAYAPMAAKAGLPGTWLLQAVWVRPPALTKKRPGDWPRCHPNWEPLTTCNPPPSPFPSSSAPSHLVQCLRHPLLELCHLAEHFFC